MPGWSRSARRLAVAVAVVAGLVAGLTGVAEAFFTRPAVAGATIGTKRIFPGTHTWSAWSIRDASGGGAEVNASEPLSAAGDARTATTGNWATAFAANRWYEADLPDVLPGGVAVTAATLRLNLRSTAGTTCVYVEVRRRSTGAVVATRGSTAAPLGCAGLTATTLTSAITEVTTTDLADDLRIRVYGRNTLLGSAVIDELTITGSTAYGPYSLLPVLATNAASGAGTVTTWSLAAAGDGAVYANANNWPTGFNNNRYLLLGFAAEVPTGATVTDAVLTHTYRDQGGNTACYWLEAYAGATLVGTHGSTATPFCHTGTGYGTDVIDLTGVTTAAAANTLTLKLYLRVPGGGTRRVQHDAVTLTVDYHLD